MTMSSTKKKQTISDQINDILKPKELVEETDDNEAKFEEFSEHHDVDQKLSEIRKQTAKSLSELDSKYKGKIVSRKELEEENGGSEDSSDEDDEIENGANYATDSDEDDENESMEDEVEAEEEENSDDEEDEDESGSDFDDLGDDFDLSQFAQPKPSSLKTPTTSTHVEKTEILKDVSLNEEIKKGISVQNQLKLWEKLLEVRIKSQKVLITANSMPDFDSHLELTTMEDQTFTEKVEQTCDGIHGLLGNLLELQSTLVKK
jgi:protein AATF/BFR2